MTTMAPVTTTPPGGGAWRVEEYTKNTGSVGTKKIVFFGASYRFVHKVLRDMLLVGGFNDVHLMVHDIDPEPMNVVADLLERIARQQKSNVKVSRSLDRREALKGADAVVLSITTGGRESDQRSWEVCAKYGIPICVGDTLGPAALARNLRTVPVVLALGKEMEELCPNAVMLNFTNPMSVLTSVLNRYTSIPRTACATRPMNCGASSPACST
jgi:alpha-galactosidase